MSDLNDPRVLFAAERTLLAWNRTSLSIIAFGFVVETENFTDDTWIWAEGRISFHTDQLKIVERYSMPDANTLLIDATLTDEGALTAPWVIPTQRLVKAPFDQLLPLICTGVETQELMDNAAELAQ